MFLIREDCQVNHNWLSWYNLIRFIEWSWMLASPGNHKFRWSSNMYMDHTTPLKLAVPCFINTYRWGLEVQLATSQYSFEVSVIISTVSHWVYMSFFFCSTSFDHPMVCMDLHAMFLYGRLVSRESEWWVQCTNKSFNLEHSQPDVILIDHFLE